MKKPILIASSSLDIHTTGPVIERLRKRGYPVIQLEGDKIAQCQRQFAIRLGNKNSPRVYYDNQPLDLLQVGAAWFRRPSNFRHENDIDIDGPRYESLAFEYMQLQKFIWNSIRDPLWLNSPANIERAEDKLSQLVLAQELGFATPKTIVGNKWKDIVQLPKGKLVFKMPRGKLSTKDEDKIMYTALFDNSPDSLPLQSAPYPGIWQSYVEKKREWRITVIGNKTFDAAIYTDSDAKNDWRQKQSTPSVTFKSEPFPKALQQKCVQMLKRLDLRYGAFDFVEAPNGEIVFLEVNPNGQYGWVQHALDLPISDAIAAELMRIARS